MSNKLILVLNCGSSSMKGAVLDNDTGEVLLSCAGRAKVKSNKKSEILL